MAHDHLVQNRMQDEMSGVEVIYVLGHISFRCFVFLDFLCVLFAACVYHGILHCEN